MIKERFDQSYRYLDRMKSHFDQQDTKLDKLSENLKRTNQRVASLEQDARQPRFAMEVDGPSDTKTRERTEGAAKAVQVMHGDSFSANRVDHSINFGVKAEPPALPCRDDVLVKNGAAAPKSCRSPLEMRSPIAADGLIPAGKASTTTRITFYQPHLRFYPTEETNSEKTSTQYALYYNSSFWWNQLPAPSWRRVIRTKSRKNLIFDPGGSKGRLSACPLLGTWRALLCGELLVLERRVVPDGAAFFSRKYNLGINLQEKYWRITPCVLWFIAVFFAAADLKMPCRRRRLKGIGCQG